MSADAPKRGHAAGLPKATISYTYSPLTNGICEVLVDGEPVAFLAATSFEFAHEQRTLARFKIGVLAGDVKIESLDDQLGGTHT